MRERRTREAEARARSGGAGHVHVPTSLISHQSSSRIDHEPRCCESVLGVNGCRVNAWTGLVVCPLPAKNLVCEFFSADYGLHQCAFYITCLRSLDTDRHDASSRPHTSIPHFYHPPLQSMTPAYSLESRLAYRTLSTPPPLVSRTPPKPRRTILNCAHLIRPSPAAKD